MPNYDMYNTDPYMRFLNWRNSKQPVNPNAPLVNPQSSITGDYLGSNYLNPLKGRQLGITPDITGQGNWQTGSNILTPQNAAGQGMTQVGDGKYVSNSLAKYYNNGQEGAQQVSPLNAGTDNNLPMTRNPEMMGPPKPGFFQNQWNKAKNSYRDSPFNKAIHPDSPWAGGAQPATAGIGGTGGTASPVTGGMGGAMGYLGAANAIMGMMNRNQGSSQPAVSRPIVVNNPPPMGGSSGRGERRNRLSSLPNYQRGGFDPARNMVIGNEAGQEGFVPLRNPNEIQAFGNGASTQTVGESPDGDVIISKEAGVVVPTNMLKHLLQNKQSQNILPHMQYGGEFDEFGNPIQPANALIRTMGRETPNSQSVFNTPTQAKPTSMESPITASIEKPGLFARIGNAFRPKEQPIPTDYNTPEGANYLNRLMAESQRKPTFTEKLPQALALMSGAFDPYGRFANANANIINMTQQQEQARRQAPVNYLNQVMARSQAENLPLQQKLSQAQLAHLEAQTKALRVRPKLAGTKEVVKQMPDGTYHSMLVHENTGRVIQDLGIATPKQTGYDKATRLDTYTAEVDGKPMEVERTSENIAKYPAYMEEKKDKFEKQVEDYEKYFTRGMDKLSPEELGRVRKSEDYQKALASYIKPDITGVQSYEYKPKAEKEPKWYARLLKPKDFTNQTQGIIDKALQEVRANATQNIVLPEEIKTRSQAIEFLKSDQGMTAEQALQWIEAND